MTGDPGGGSAPFIRLEGIVKRFGAIEALRGVSLAIPPATTLALLGHNGAGKSTLMNILAGTLRPDRGAILIAGEDHAAHWQARRAYGLGIRCVFQELSLCPNLDAVENTRILHREISGRGWRRRTEALLEETLGRIFGGMKPGLRHPVGSLSLAARQMIEIARAFLPIPAPPRLVILDEPTSSLGAQAAEALLRFLPEAHRDGTAVIFISHRLREVLTHCRRVVVMRDGEITAQRDAAELTPEGLVELMGSARAATTSDEARAKERERVRVSLRLPSLPGGPSALIAREAEIVGLAGLDGHGQRASLLRLFAAAQGARMPDVRLDGRVAYVSGDRPREGVFPLWTVGHNLTVGLIRRIQRWGWLPAAREREIAEDWRGRLQVRAPSIATPILALSGGNQQKVLIARALAAEPDILLLDDPMRGVDIGTKRELFAVLRDEAARGRTILLYTTETEELVHCDRTYVFFEGRLADEIPRAAFNEERLLRASFAHAA